MTPTHQRQPDDLGVRFKEDIEMLDGPVVCAEDQPPLKLDGKADKDKKFFFFKKKKKVRHAILICYMKSLHKIIQFTAMICWNMYTKKNISLSTYKSTMGGGVIFCYLILFSNSFSSH